MTNAMPAKPPKEPTIVNVLTDCQAFGLLVNQFVMVGHRFHLVLTRLLNHCPFF